MGEKSDQFGRVSVVATLHDILESESDVETIDPPEGGHPSQSHPQVARERYAVDAPIGAGGMGEVLLVTDNDLRRQVAMKQMRSDKLASVQQRLRFVAEAQATSQLEHPGIPPVHDIGIAPQGGVYFTMKLVRGRTLGEVLHDLLVGRPEVRREFTLHRLITILERVCEAVHFAHEKGVLHRDLKPDNLMLGDYGEVHVMDWGIALIRGETEDPLSGEEAVATAGTDEGLRTMAGAVVGTLPYMSPEQANAERETLDRRTDVYALGCILYEMLTLHRAFEGGAKLHTRVFEGDFPPVATRNPRRPVPEFLGELCTRSMARDRDGRPESAAAMAAELRGWLDGRAEAERRHAEAEALAKRGIAAVARYEALRGEVADAERAADAKERDFKPWQSVAESRPVIDARERVEELRTDVALAFADATRLFDGALLAEPQNATARAALADLWRGRHADAEREANRPDTAYAETMIRRYDDGRLAPYLAGDGTLELASDPPGAQVLLFRFEEEDGVLLPQQERDLGATPLGPVDLPMGSYLCLLRKEGYPDVRYPVHITRRSAWNGSVRMRTEEEIGDGFVYVPGGPFIYGEGRDTTIKVLPDFVIKRYPVTFGEYAVFLAAVEAERGEEVAAALIPGTPGQGTFMGRDVDGTYAMKPMTVDGVQRERYDREYGSDWLSRVPVIGVSWHDANAYCAWKTKASGRDWRLPSEEEREKAARGVDGRQFPWGELAHASLCKNRDARSEPAQPEPVGTFASSASVYGMGDAAGNVWDWTSSPFEPHLAASKALVIRGGGWYSSIGFMRAGDRNSSAPDGRSSASGFRPARSLPT